MTTFTKFHTLPSALSCFLFIMLMSLTSLAQPHYAISTELMEQDEAHSVQITPFDGGTITTGESIDPGGKIYLNIAKYDAAGTLMWSMVYDWGTDLSVGNAIELTSDGGYIVAGRLSSPTTGMINALLLKVDAIGMPMWSEIYDYSSPYAEAFSVEEIVPSFGTIDTRGSSSVPTYVWTGATINAFNGTLDHVTVVTDPFGAIMFTGILETGMDEEGRSVKPWFDPATGTLLGYATCGYSTFGAPGKNATATLLDPTLSVILWGNIYGDTGDEEGNSLEILPSGEVYVTGYSDSYSNGFKDIFTTMFDPTGGFIWSAVAGRQYDEVARSIEVLASGDLAVGGWTNYAAGKRHQGVIATLSGGTGTLIAASSWGKSEDDEFFSVKEVFTAAGTVDLVATGFFGASLTAPADTREIYNVRTDVGLLAACANPLPYLSKPVSPLFDHWPLDPGVFGYSSPEFPAPLPVFIAQHDRCCSCADMFVDFTAPAGPICAGSTATFANLSTCVDDFRWSVNGVVTSYSPTFSYTFPGPGTYTITLDGRNSGCPIVSKSITIVVSCSPKIGQSTELGDAMSISPNPAQQHALVDVAMIGMENGEAQISLIDLAGRKIQQLTASVVSGRIQHLLDVSDLPEGVYMVHVDTGNYQASSRLAVTR